MEANSEATICADNVPLKTVSLIPRNLPWPKQNQSMISRDQPQHFLSLLEVVVPASAKIGSKLAVPVPKKGEKVEEVVKRQQEHSTGAKVAMAGAAAVGLGAVALAALFSETTLPVAMWLRRPQRASPMQPRNLQARKKSNLTE